MTKAPLDPTEQPQTDANDGPVDATRRGMVLAAPLWIGAVATPAIAAAAAPVTPEVVRTQTVARFPGQGPIPWITRIYHLYTGDDGRSRVEELPVASPKTGDVARLLRRTAVRVTIGGAAAGQGYDFHVADYPTLLIAITGSIIFKLHDGSMVELKPGELAIAEDCTGQGHISYAGAAGSLSIFVQLPKELCPASGSSDMSKFWTD